MAADRPNIIINEALCFIVRKRGRIPPKQLKSLLIDFYSTDVIAAAKDVLIEAVTPLNIDGLPKMPRIRRNSKESPEIKMKIDLDDIVATVDYLDINNAIDRLPTFAAADPDHLPSARLLEGDLLAIMNKLTKMDERLTSLQHEVEVSRGLSVMGGGIIGRRGGGGNGGGGRGNGGGASATGSWPILTPNLFPVSALTSHAVGMPAAAARRTVDLATESECPTSAPDTEDEGYERNVTRNVRRSNKRARPSISPATASYSEATRRDPAETAVKVTVTKPTAFKPPAHVKRTLMIGRASGGAIMKAARHLSLPKSVYRIANIDSCYTEEHLRDYLESIGVRVVSCFDRTSSVTPFTDNKTFRVCILDTDKKALLLDSNWSVGISIQKWLFRPKQQAMDTADTGDDDSRSTQTARTRADLNGAIGEVVVGGGKEGMGAAGREGSGGGMENAGGEGEEACGREDSTGISQHG
jgi:hypothetical protein